jgi:hypothetical protein
MEAFAAILTDLDPQHVLELGRDHAGEVWSAVPPLADSQVVHLDERARWADEPAALASELASRDVAFDLVIDHATDVVASTVGVFEVGLGWVAPAGLYVIDAMLPRPVVLELMFASVASPEVIESVALTAAGVVVRRGVADPVFDRLRLTDLTSDPFGIVV